MIDYTIIGNRIREARLKHNLTQRELAELINLSPEYVSKIECGKVKINLSRMDELCLLLNIKLEYLVTGITVETNDYINELLEDYPKEKVNKIIKLLKFVIEEL